MLGQQTGGVPDMIVQQLVLQQMSPVSVGQHVALQQEPLQQF